MLYKSGTLDARKVLYKNCEWGRCNRCKGAGPSANPGRAWSCLLATTAPDAICRLVPTGAASLEDSDCINGSQDKPTLASKARVDFPTRTFRTGVPLPFKNLYAGRSQQRHSDG